MSYVRPGDMAIVVKPGSRFNLMGRIFRIVARSPAFADCWQVDPPVIWKDMEIDIAEECLRPIRDPGDDAIDLHSRRTPRSIDIEADQATRARKTLRLNPREAA